MKPLQRIAQTTYLALVTPGTTHVPVWISPPGGGKTTVARWLARALGVRVTIKTLDGGGNRDCLEPADDFVAWIGAQHPPEDFAGWPTPRADGLHFEAPHQVARLASAHRSMFLIDEMGNMPRATQAGALRLFHERAIGEFDLPETNSMMGAMNPAESGTDAHEMSKALANRVVWLRFPDMTPEEHLGYMVAGQRPAEPFAFPPFDPAAWERAYSRVMGMYAGFQRIAGFALREDDESEEVMARSPLAYCTPRSWTAALCYTATCLAMDDLAALPDLVYGAIGQPVGSLWVTHVLDSDHVDPEAALADPSIVRFDPARPDRAFSEMTSIAMAGCMNGLPAEQRIARWHAAWQCADRFIDQGAPKAYMVDPAQHLGTNKPPGEVLATVKAIIADLREVIAASHWSEP